MSFFSFCICQNLHCFYWTKSTQVPFAEKPQMKINNLKTKQKHEYLSHKSDNAFKGTVVYRELPSLNGGSLEITLTVLHFKVWNKKYKNPQINGSKRVQH